jgi:hypothetical protein
MTASLADFEVRLSGGASNTTPTASTGGAMSTVSGGRVLSQAATGLTTLTGVTIDDAAGNAEGVGSLFFDYSALTLRWTPPSGTAGSPVIVSASGEYAIQGGNNGGVLLVTVVAASLPTSDQTNSITIANQTAKMWDDVSKAESLAGASQYRGFYFKNAHATDAMTNIKFWMAQNTPGQDNLQIANCSEAKNTAIETLSDELDPPTAINFDANNPIDLASALSLVDLSAGDYKGFWMKRTIPAGVTAAQTANTFRLGFQIYV